MQVCPILDKEAKSSRSPPVIPDLIGNTSNQPRLTYHPRNTIHGFSPTPSRCKSGSSRGHIVVPDLIGNTSKPTSPHLSSPKYDSWILSHSIPMQIGIQPRTHCRSRPDREYIKTNLASLIIPEIRSMDSLPLHPDANLSHT